ncbi:carboxypeptidase-like regulatory domain-containing protein [Eisenibacter elegans]|uniref:carboxypeptidase-like regulatory domain-containing protein n=1 Tax=Eisenibacter elegans TaxID=997 RepID=UPI00047E284D|nr:carboxypeptidase-like regulatory domain-containing protein [Eisenibacter elegans]
MVYDQGSKKQEESQCKVYEQNLMTPKDVPVFIYGTVVDEKYEPIPSVTIFIQGTNRGTATDINGKFAFQVPKEFHNTRIKLVARGIALSDQIKPVSIKNKSLFIKQIMMMFDSFTGDIVIIRR